MELRIAAHARVVCVYICVYICIYVPYVHNPGVHGRCYGLVKLEIVVLERAMEVAS